MSKKAICILSVNANNETFSFAETLKNDSYDIYICIDNNNSILPDFDTSKITIIRFYDNECENNYFTGSVVYTHDRACSRDKALYYFCSINNNYDYIWFLEEDVFIPTKNTIQRIDNIYINTNADILSAFNDIKLSYDDPNCAYWQHWWRNENKIKYPWAHSMISAIRVSKKMLECISNFVKINKYLLFDELLFNTIAIQNNLIIETPSELSNIVFSFNDIIPTTINSNFLYHPIKNLLKQNELRQQL
jgi:hypothetical protein